MEEVLPARSDEVSNNAARHSSFSKEALGTTWVAFFFTVFNASVGGRLIILSVIAGFACCCLLYHREIYHFLVHNKIVGLYAIVVLASATWSTVPSLSLWYGLQLTITIAAGIFAGIAATPRQIVRGIFVATSIVIIASVISGRQGASAAGPVLVGVTGSKTVIGLVGAMLVGAGMAIIFDRGQPFSFRLLSLPLTPVGFYIATHVQAASAAVCAVALPIAFFGLFSLRYLNPANRSILAFLFLVLSIPLTILVSATVLSGNADQKILRAFNKDVTLTGRTKLWAKADYWIEESPIFGHGFRAFWESSSSDSLGILHHAKLLSSRGFQLHSTIKEIRVDTGWIGLIAFLVTAIFFLYKIMSFAFLYPSAGSAFLAAVYLMTLANASLMTIIGALFPPTMIFYLCGTAAIVFFMNRSTDIKFSASE